MRPQQKTLTRQRCGGSASCDYVDILDPDLGSVLSSAVLIMLASSSFPNLLWELLLVLSLLM